MNDFERDMQEMMTRRGEDVRHEEVPFDRVIRKVRVRQSIAGVTVVALLAAGGILMPRLFEASGKDGRQIAPVATHPSENGGSDIGPGEYEVGDDSSTPHRIEVARGEREGKPWTLYAFEEKGGWCDGFDWGESGGTGCPSIRARDHIAVGWIGSDPTSPVSGAVSDEVASLEVTLEGEDPVEIPVIPGPEELDTNYYLLFAPHEHPGEIVARDSGGRELQRVEFLNFPMSCLEPTQPQEA